MNVNKKKIVIIGLILCLCFPLVGGTAIAQTDETDNSNNGEDTTEDDEEINSSVRSSSTQKIDVSRYLTITEEKWYSDGTVEVTVRAERRHSVDWSVHRGGIDAKRGTVTVPEGESTIILEDVDEWYNLWSGSDGVIIERPSIQVLNLPVPEWVFTWWFGGGTVTGTIAIIIYSYKRIQYKKVNKVESIFEIEWW